MKNLARSIERQLARAPVKKGASEKDFQFPNCF